MACAVQATGEDDDQDGLVLSSTALSAIRPMTFALRGGGMDEDGGVCWRAFFGVTLSLLLSLILAMDYAMRDQDCRQGKGRCDVAND